MDIVLSYPAVERVPNIMVTEKGLRKQGVETRSLATGGEGERGSPYHVLGSPHFQACVALMKKNKQ